MRIAEVERQLKTLGNRRRLAILDFLRKRKNANVSDISEAIKLSFTSTSKHLTMLERQGFVDKEQKSLNVFYRLSADAPAVLPKLFSIF